MPALKKLKNPEIRAQLPRPDADLVVESGESVFILEIKRNSSPAVDPLIDVEVSLRRGERVGLFTEDYAGEPKD